MAVNQPSLEEIWGIVPDSEEEQQPSLTNTSGGPAVPSSSSSAPSDTLTDQQIQQAGNPSTWGQLRSLGASFVEGVAYSSDLFDADETGAVPDWANTAARWAGEGLRTIGEILFTGGAFTVASRATKIGSWFYQTARSSPYVSRVLEALGKNAALGGSVSAVDQLLAPEERKPGLKGTVENVALFAGGGVGNLLTRSALQRYVPNAKAGFKDVVSFVGDNIGATIAALPVTQDKERLLEESLGPHVLAIGVFDVLTNAISRGRIKNTPEVSAAVNRAESALDAYQATGSESEAQAFWDATQDAFDKGFTPDSSSKLSVAEQTRRMVQEVLDEADEAPPTAATAEAPAVRRTSEALGEPVTPPEPPRPDVVPVRRATEALGEEVTPPPHPRPEVVSVEEQTRRMVQEVLAEEPSPPSPSSSPSNRPSGEQVQQLADELTAPFNRASIAEAEYLETQHTPRQGEAINTTRYDTTADARKTISTFAAALKDRSVQPHEAVKKKAVQQLARESGIDMSDIETLQRALAAAPETVTRYRALIASNAKQTRELASKIKQNPQGISDLELAQYLYHVNLQAQLTSSLTDVEQKVGRTLSANRIIVGDDWVDLTSLTRDDIRGVPDAQAKVEAAIDAAGGRDKVIKQAEDLLDNTGTDDVPGVSKKSRRQVKDTRVIDAIIEGRQSSLLTSGLTHVGNFVSQALYSMLNHIDESFAAGVGKILRHQDRYTAREVAARIAGDVGGMYSSFVRPIVRVKDLDGVTHYKYVPTAATALIDLMTLRPEQVEEMIRRTALNPRISAEGRPHNALSSQNLKGTWLGKIVDKMPLSQAAWFLLDKTASYQRVASFGMLELTDRPFTYGAYFAELEAQLVQRLRRGEIKPSEIDDIREQVKARRKEILLREQFDQQAASSGLSGEELSLQRSQIRDQVTDIQWSKLSPERRKLVDELDELALNFSNEMTWKSPPKSRFGKAFENFLRQVPVTRFVIPFYRAPSQIISRAIDYMPVLGQIKLRQDILGKNGTRAQELAIAKMVVGAGLYAWASTLAINGLITGAAYSESQKQAMQDAGIPEKSVKIGDKWYNYNRFDPAPGSFFGIVADVVALANDPDAEVDTVEGVISAVITVIANNVLNKNWMTGVQETLNAISDPNRAGSWLPRTVNTFFPFYGARNFLREVQVGGLNPWYDPHWQEAETLMEHLLPSLARDMLDGFGKPVPTRGNVWGLRYQEQSDSPIRNELVRLGMGMTRPSKTLYGQELTPEQYHEFRRLFDNPLQMEERLNQIISLPTWGNLTDEMKRQMIERLYSRFRQQAAQLFLANNNEVREKVLKKIREDNLSLIQDLEAREVWAPWIEQ